MINDRHRKFIRWIALKILISLFLMSCSDDNKPSSKVKVEDVRVGSQEDVATKTSHQPIPALKTISLEPSPELANLNSIFNSAETTSTELEAAYQSKVSLYPLPLLEGFVVEASAPIFVEGASLVDDAKVKCENLSYSDSIVSMDQLVSQIQTAGKCGKVEFNFCFKTRKKPTESSSDEIGSAGSSIDEYSYFQSETSSIPYPCDSTIFATPQIVLGSREYAATNIENPTLGYKTSPFLSRYYTTFDPDCKTGGEWRSTTNNQNPWLFDFSSTPTTKVYAKFEDIFGEISVCYQYEITYDTEAPKDLELAIGSSDFSTSINVKLNLTSSSQDIVKLHVINGLCSEEKIPEENSVAYLHDGEPIDWQLNDIEGVAQSVAVYAEDNAGNMECIEKSVTVDKTPPSIENLSFPKGTHTNTREVDLVVSYTDATHYFLSQVNCNDEEKVWQEVAGSPMTIPVTLTEGEGFKTVYVGVKDRANNEPDCLAASIFLDTTSPALSLITLDSDSLTTDSDYRVEVSWDAAQDNSPIDSYQLSLATKDSEGSYSITAQQQVTDLNNLFLQFPKIRLSPWKPYYVLLQATDFAGNTSELLECETPINYHQKVLDTKASVARTCITVEDDEGGGLAQPLRKLKCWGGSLSLGFDLTNLDGTTHTAGSIDSYGKNLPFVKLPYEKTGGGIKTVSLGIYHTCAVAMNGTVRCWGVNSSGRLGLGIHRNDMSNLGDSVDGNKKWPITPTDENPDPALVPLGELIPEDICATELTTCILVKRNGTYTKDDGSEVERKEVACWGDISLTGTGQSIADRDHIGFDPDDMIRVENGNEISNLESVKLVDPDVDATVLDLSCGRFYSCVLLEFSDSSTKVKCWGRNFSGNLISGSLGQAIVPVGENPFNPTSDKLVMGDSVDEVGSYNPETGTGMPPVVLPPGRVKDIESTWHSTCALMEDSTSLYCWGLNHNGQLGRDDNINHIGFYLGSMASLKPVDLPMKNNQPPVITSLHFGADSSCALTADKDLYCWGRDSSGMFGVGSMVDAKIGDGLDNGGNIKLEMGQNLRPTIFISGFSVGKVSMGQWSLCAVSDESSTPHGLLACYGSNGGLGRIDPNLTDSRGGSDGPMLPRP